MTYALIRDGQVAVYPYSFSDLRRDNPDVSFPREPSDDNFAAHGAMLVQAVDPPEAGEGQAAVEGSPEVVDGVPRQTWTLVDAPPPPKRQVAKSVILERLTDAQLDAALALLSPRQKERWRAPGYPTVNFDDSDTLAVLAAIGADPAVVMAE